MRFTRTADHEAIELYHPRHPQPIRMLFSGTGPLLDETIIIDRNHDRLPFGTIEFLDITIMPGRLRMTHRGIALDVMDVVLREPRGEHQWGTAVELDFRTADTSGEHRPLTAPAASP